MMKEEKLISTEDLAKLLAISPRTLRNWSKVLEENGHAIVMGGGEYRKRYAYFESAVGFMQSENREADYVRANAEYVNGRGWYSGGLFVGKNIDSAFANMSGKNEKKVTSTEAFLSGFLDTL